MPPKQSVHSPSDVCLGQSLKDKDGGFPPPGWHPSFARILF